MLDIENQVAQLQQFVERVNETAIPEKYTGMFKLYKSFIKAQLSIALNFASHFIDTMYKVEVPSTPETMVPEREYKKYAIPVVKPEAAWNEKIPFGMYKNSTLKEVFDSNIGYLKWCSEQGNITGRIKGAMIALQDEINAKFKAYEESKNSKQSEVNHTDSVDMDNYSMKDYLEDYLEIPF